MGIISDIAKEIPGMFIADSRFALSILGLVGFIAFLIKIADVPPLPAGGGLLAGCLIILSSSVRREAHRRQSDKPVDD